MLHNLISRVRNSIAGHVLFIDGLDSRVVAR